MEHVDLVIDGDLPRGKILTVCQDKAEICFEDMPQPQIVKQVTHITKTVEKPYKVTVAKKPDLWPYGIATAILFAVAFTLKSVGGRRKRTDIFHHKG